LKKLSIIVVILEPKVSVQNNIYLLEDQTETSCVLLIGKTYLSYVISNMTGDVIYRLKHYSSVKPFTKNDLQEVLAQPDISDAKKHVVALDSYKSVIVPYALYQPEEKYSYFQFLEELHNEEDVYEHNITNSVVDLYVIKNSTHVFIHSLISNPTVVHSGSILLRTYAALLNPSNNDTFFISVKEDFIILTHYQESILQLHQVYACTTELDVLYFTSMVVQQSNIHPGTLEIQLHGEQNNMQRMFDRLQQHYSKVKFCSRLASIHYPDELYKQPTHHFINLISAMACVS
jgi:hypothetical protein